MSPAPQRAVSVRSTETAPEGLAERGRIPAPRPRLPCGHDSCILPTPVRTATSPFRRQPDGEAKAIHPYTADLRLLTLSTVDP